jgi:rare lipoprotein A
MTRSAAPVRSFGQSTRLALLALVISLGATACATTAPHGNEQSFKAKRLLNEVAYLQTGKASYYALKFKNRRTANGERYDPEAFTAAHPRLKFGTLLLVKRKATGRYVVVRVNDRGPHTGGRVLDLSTAAARKLGILRRGVAEVDIYKIDPQSGYASQL